MCIAVCSVVCREIFQFNWLGSVQNSEQCCSVLCSVLCRFKYCVDIKRVYKAVCNIIQYSALCSLQFMLINSVFFYCSIYKYSVDFVHSVEQQCL